MPDKVDVGVPVTDPAPHRPVLGEGIAVRAVGMGRLATEHGPGTRRRGGKIPVRTGPVVTVRRNHSSGRSEVIEELDEIIGIVDEVLVGTDVVVAVVPATGTLLALCGPVGDGISQDHRAGRIVGVCPGNQLERVVKPVSIGVGIGRIGRRVAIDFIEIGEPVTIGVGGQGIGTELISIGDPVTIAVGVQGVGTGLVLAGIGETILVGICIST